MTIDSGAIEQGASLHPAILKKLTRAKIPLLNADETTYRNWLDDVRHPVHNMNLLNGITTPSIRTHIAEFATHMLPFGNLNAERSIDVDDLQILVNDQTYIVDCGIQVPKVIRMSERVATTLEEFRTSPITHITKELPPENLFIDIFMNDMNGKGLHRDTVTDVPTHIYLNSDGKDINLFATEASIPKMEQFTEQDIDTYIQAISRSLSLKQQGIKEL